MLARFLLLLSFAMFTTQCRPPNAASSSASSLDEFEIHELAEYDHKLFDKFSEALEGQRSCLVTVNKPGGPNFLLFTAERVVSWAGFLEKGCLQERYLKDIPEKMKIPLWTGPVRELEVQGLSIPWGAQAFDVLTDLLGEVNGVKVPVGMLVQQKVIKDGRIFRRGGLKLLTLCQFGEIRADVFSRNCKLEVSHPYKHPKTMKSLQLVAPR